jgi:hypothetical protein
MTARRLYDDARGSGRARGSDDAPAIGPRAGKHARPARRQTPTTASGRRRGAILTGGLSPFDRFRLLCADLGLVPEWTLSDDGETAGDDCAAAVTPADDYHVAGFAISRTGWPTDRADQLTVLLHEASHLLLADLVHAAETAISQLPAGPGQEIARAHLRRQEELTCDRLARTMADRIGLGEDRD